MRAVRANLRLWLPFAAAVVCLAATFLCGPVLTVVLMIAALGFVLDGATLLWARLGGGMSQHRQ
jgi:hypothetical protein